VSRDIMGAFRQSRAYEQLGRIDLYVNVLTFGSWPAYPVMDVAVPADVRPMRVLFARARSLTLSAGPLCGLAAGTRCSKRWRCSRRSTCPSTAAGG